MNGTTFLANLRFPYINSFRDRHDKTRHYFRRPGFKSVALPGLPGSAEFMEAYQAALAGSTAPRIGSNLNQIARACNATGDTFRARNIEATLDELRGLLRRMDTPGQSSDELGEG
jgi:hypothetical protein